MPRLPIPGQDDGTWGSVLNDYLSTSINTDGSLKSSAITNSGAAADSSVVHNSTNETVAGIKTFSSSPLVPTPTTSTQATNKAYVDSTVSAGAVDATTTNKGIVKLAGDLGGTAALPTVPGLAAKADDSAVLKKANNLSDVANASTALSNLGAAPALSATAVKTAAYTTAANQLVPADATTAAFTVTLPTAPADKSRITVKKIDTTANAVMVTAGGSDVFNKTGGSTSVSLSLQNQAVSLQYSTTGGIWYVVSDSLSLTGLNATYALIPRTTTKKAVAQDELFFNVKDYGAVGGIGAVDDSAAIQAAVNAAANGGIVYFPPGYYRVSTTITVAKPTTFQGVAAGFDGSGVGSGIMTTSGINGFTVTSPRVSFRNLMFLANTTEGASVAAKTWAIKFDTGGGDSCSVRDCLFQYYYYGVWFVGGQLWTVADNVFHSLSGYQVLISNVATPDGGDQNLRGNAFQSGTAVTGILSSGGTIGSTTMTLATSPAIAVGSTIVGTGIPANTSVTAVAGSLVTFNNAISGSNASGTYTFDNWGGLAQVRQESGGGTRVVGNKFINGPIGYQVAPTDGAGTSILPMTANSFELHTFAHIHLTTGTGGANTGTFKRIVITGNQFTSTKVSQAALYCDTTTAQFAEVMFNSNTCVGIAAVTTFVRLSAVSGVTVTNNYFYTGLSAVTCTGGSSDMVISPNHLKGITSIQYRADNVSSATFVPVSMEAYRNFTVTSSSTYFQTSYVSFSAAGSCLLEITVFGTLTGAASGMIAGTYKRLVVLPTLGSTPTVTVVGTDTTGSVPFDMNFDATQNNGCYIQIKRNPGDGGSSIQGAIAIKAYGSQSQVY